MQGKIAEPKRNKDGIPVDSELESSQVFDDFVMSDKPFNDNQSSQKNKVN